LRSHFFVGTVFTGLNAYFICRCVNVDVSGKSIKAQSLLVFYEGVFAQ